MISGKPFYTASLLAALMFASTPAVANAFDGYQQQTGNFVKLEVLSAKGTMAHSMSSASPGTQLMLFSENQQIKLQPSNRYQHLSAFNGKVRAQRNNAEDEDVIVVKNAQGGFLVLYPDRQQMIYQPATGQQTLLTFNDNPLHPEAIDADEEAPGAATKGITVHNNISDYSSQADIDAEGNYVIDMLVGFSKAAKEAAFDPEAFAFAQVESINQALKNSQIEGIKIRLVGIQVIDKDYPIHNQNIAHMPDAFAEGLEKYSPDLLAAFFVGDKSIDNAVAWGQINGYITINKISSPTALRHEVGHNVGGSHCSSNTTSGYKHGWNNGKSQTIMCGNTTGYYSNPALKDRFGLPLGNKNKADMARVWHEAKTRLSARRPAIVPLNKENITLLSEKLVNLNADNNYQANMTITAPKNAEKIVISALPSTNYLENGKYTLDVSYSDGATGFINSLGMRNYRLSNPSYYPSYSITQPDAGDISINVYSNAKDIQGILLRAWAVSNSLENSGAENGDLTGWTLNNGQFRVVTTQDNIQPAEGKYYFTARKNNREAGYASYDSMSQTFALNPLALTSASTVKLTFMSNGWGDGDYGTVAILAKNKQGDILNSNTVTTQGKKQQWIPYSLNVPLPAGAEQVEINVTAYPKAGEMNDVHFDNFRFTVAY